MINKHGGSWSKPNSERPKLNLLGLIVSMQCTECPRRTKGPITHLLYDQVDVLDLQLIPLGEPVAA